MICGGVYLCICGSMGDDALARQIVQPNTDYGKSRLEKLGSGDELVRDGHISLHRRVPGVDDAVIDVWLINAAGPSSPTEASNPIGTVLMFHGITDSKASYLGVGKKLADRGFDVLLIDSRAHGRSSGDYVTWGAKEKWDAKAVADAFLAEGRTRAPTYALGTSFGGGVAVQYASADPRCHGVVALAPFKDAASIGRRIVMPWRPLASKSDIDAVMKRAGDIAGFDAADASTVTAAAKLTCPVLLIHGKKDWKIPVSHSQAVYDAAKGPKNIVLVEEAGHDDLINGREDWVISQLVEIASTHRRPAGSP